MLSEERTDEDDVGGYCDEKDLSNAFNSAVGRPVLAFKAVRRVGNHLGLPIGEGEINLLCAVFVWSNELKRKGGLTRVINWTGYSRPWKAKMYIAAKKCISHELLEEKPVSGGKRLLVTEKGMRVLEVFSQMLETVKLEEIAKALQGNSKYKAVA